MLNLIKNLILITFLYSISYQVLAIRAPNLDLPKATSIKGEESKTYEIDCWEASLYDQDGDGYAEQDTNISLRETKSVPFSEKFTCPIGWVLKRGDCNDNDSDVHPRSIEIADNGIDDNCNGKKDEPQIIYNYNGLNNKNYSFDLKVKLNNSEMRSLVLTKKSLFSQFSLTHLPKKYLSYEIEYQKLSDSTTEPLVTNKRAITNSSSYYLKLSLNNLDPTTVYRAKVRFYQTSTSINGTIKYSPIGEETDWYYTTTDGDNELSNIRTKILLKGFYEYYLSEFLGYVGYLGVTYIDGTRYGGEKGEAWCSEFYSWTVNTQLSSIGHIANVADMITYFTGFNLLEEDNLDSVPGYLQDGEDLRGDYLAINGTTHSAMLLTYDAVLGEYWTLDGNSTGTNVMAKSDRQLRQGGSEVMVRNREVSAVTGWGRLSADLK